MEQLRFFSGSWTCAGKQFASPFGPEHPFVGTSTDQVALGGHWHQWTYSESHDERHAGVVVAGTWGWDAAAHRFFRSAHDDHGGWESASSTGFQGDKFVWNGAGALPVTGPFEFRQTFTKDGRRQWKAVYELRAKDGWIPFEEVTCTRTHD